MNNTLVIVLSLLLALGLEMHLEKRNADRVEKVKTETNQVMESWVGHTDDELIASWGPPKQVLQTAEGKILVYTETITYTARSGHITTTPITNKFAISTYTPPEMASYDKNRMFWVNDSGRIYKWSWKGL